MAVTVLPPAGPGGPRRVNIDVRNGTVVSRPGDDPLQLIGELARADVPVAVIDLDRSTGVSEGTELLEVAVRRHPGRVWAGGRLSPATPLAFRLLDIGAAGIIAGPSALFANGWPDPVCMAALAWFPEPGRIMASIDVLDGRVAINGFTTPTRLAATDAIDAIAQATSGACAVLFTDVAAATRRNPPDWDWIAGIAGRYPWIPLWYAGGLDTWASIRHAWDLGLGAVTGQAYLTGRLGLPA
jgi:phosphoribosylformimino-5-aminoimidazole carboxamide ribonucleotide (ProFAR) isomerase